MIRIWMPLFRFVVFEILFSHRMQMKTLSTENLLIWHSIRARLIIFIEIVSVKSEYCRFMNCLVLDGKINILYLTGRYLVRLEMSSTNQSSINQLTTSHRIDKRYLCYLFDLITIGLIERVNDPTRIIFRCLHRSCSQHPQMFLHTFLRLNLFCLALS